MSVTLQQKLDFLRAVSRFMEAEYGHAKAISDHVQAGGAPMGHSCSRDEADHAHADLMAYPAIFADLITADLRDAQLYANTPDRSDPR